MLYIYIYVCVCACVYMLLWLGICDMTTAHDLSLISTLHRKALIWINASSCLHDMSAGTGVLCCCTELFVSHQLSLLSLWLNCVCRNAFVQPTVTGPHATTTHTNRLAFERPVQGIKVNWLPSPISTTTPAPVWHALVLSPWLLNPFDYMDPLPVGAMAQKDEKVVHFRVDDLILSSFSGCKMGRYLSQNCSCSLMFKVELLSKWFTKLGRSCKCSSFAMQAPSSLSLLQYSPILDSCTMTFSYCLRSHNTSIKLCVRSGWISISRSDALQCTFVFSLLEQNRYACKVGRRGQLCLWLNLTIHTPTHVLAAPHQAEIIHL